MKRWFFILLVSFYFSPLAGQNIDSLQQVLSTTQDPEVKISTYKSVIRHYRNSDTVAYRNYLNEGIAFAEQQKNMQAKFDLAFLEGQRLYGKGRYKEMVKWADSLYPLVAAAGQIEIQAKMLNYSGNALSNVSDYPNALVKFIEYLEVAQEMEDPLHPMAMANNNIGMAFLNMDRFDQAIPYLNTSLSYQAEYDSGFKAHTFWNLGICYMEKEQFEQALDFFEKGVAEAERKGDRYAAAGNQLCIGSVYVRQDRFEEGILAYDKAYRMSTNARLEPFKIIEALNGLIYANNQLSRPEAALPFIRIGDSITEHHKLSDIRNREFLFYKSATLLQLGRPQEADIVFKRYEIAVDSLHNVENMEIIQEKETEFRTKEKEQMLQLQEAQLDFQRLLNILLGAGAIILAILGVLVYRQQRLKMRTQRQEQALKEALLEVETNKKLEDQRQRIAKELHDNIGSQLTYLASAAHNIGSRMSETSTENTQLKLEDLSQFSQEAITDLRDTIWVMNRSSVTWDDLVERIRYLAHKVSNTTGISVIVEKTADAPTALNPSQTMNVYRIIQEAVNNAVKHSGGSEIKVEINPDDPVVVTILDNGSGFDPATLTESSNGLTNMRARAEQIGGRLEVLPSETGTQVKLQLPQINEVTATA